VSGGLLTLFDCCLEIWAADLILKNFCQWGTAGNVLEKKNAWIIVYLFFLLTLFGCCCFCCAFERFYLIE
jgi:hypothetical protein